MAIGRIRRRRLTRAIRQQVGAELEHRRRTNLGRLSPDSEDLTVAGTVEVALVGARHWRWSVAAAIGGRRNPGAYAEPRPWNPGPLHYLGQAPTATEAAIDARQVEDLIRTVYAELVLEPGPMPTT